MDLSLAFLDLFPAMQQGGCPVCRVRSESEKRYLQNLLLEHVTESETRADLSASLGFCPKHAWELCLLDLATYEEPIKNSMLYESLMKEISQHLAQYNVQEKARKVERKGGFSRVLKQSAAFPFDSDPFASESLKDCRICQVGDESEKYYLKALVAGLGGANSDIRAAYQASDGVCFPHFRRAFQFHDEDLSDGLAFLVEETSRKIDQMGSDLTNYIDKHSVGNNDGPMTAEERTAWLRATRFIGMHEDHTLLGNIGEVSRDGEAPEKETRNETL